MLLFVPANTCMMLSYITCKSNDNVRAILETGILPKILECLTSKEKSILIPALHIVGNIIEIDEASELDDLAIHLPHFCALLQNHRANEVIAEKIVSIILGMINNMDQMQNVLNAGLLPPVMEIFKFVSMFRQT